MIACADTGTAGYCFYSPDIAMQNSNMSVNSIHIKQIAYYIYYHTTVATENCTQLTGLKNGYKVLLVVALLPPAAK